MAQTFPGVDEDLVGLRRTGLNKSQNTIWKYESPMPSEDCEHFSSRFVMLISMRPRQGLDLLKIRESEVGSDLTRMLKRAEVFDDELRGVTLNSHQYFDSLNTRTT